VKLVVVDSVGGSLASMGAAIARHLGRADADARSSTAVGAAPVEVEQALAEIGLAPVPASPLADADASGAQVVAIDETWGARLYAGEGELQRIANARIARDRIERKLHDILAVPLL
jgi:hypothetical protein